MPSLASLLVLKLSAISQQCISWHLQRPVHFIEAHFLPLIIPIYCTVSAFFSSFLCQHLSQFEHTHFPSWRDANLCVCRYTAVVMPVLYNTTHRSRKRVFVMIATVWVPVHGHALSHSRPLFKLQACL